MFLQQLRIDLHPQQLLDRVLHFLRLPSRIHHIVARVLGSFVVLIQLHPAPNFSAQKSLHDLVDGHEKSRHANDLHFLDSNRNDVDHVGQADERLHRHGHDVVDGEARAVKDDADAANLGFVLEQQEEHGEDDGSDDLGHGAVEFARPLEIDEEDPAAVVVAFVEEHSGAALDDLQASFESLGCDVEPVGVLGEDHGEFLGRLEDLVHGVLAGAEKGEEQNVVWKVGVKSVERGLLWSDDDNFEWIFEVSII
jgi:hypothetical protein